MASQLTERTVVLGVTGGIAAYKAAELCRLLVKAGARVQVIMTAAACEFIAPLTMQTLSGREVLLDIFDSGRRAGVGHVEVASAADLIVVAPATADAIARFAAGMADDLLAAVVLASGAPILLAPAMNTTMWENPITQENLARLCRGGRATSVGPDAGQLACGWTGAGRMAEPDEILAAVLARLGSGVPARAGALEAQRVVVTAGPTWEAVDDVRFLGNRSSGKMGFALAEAAAALGAEVTLIAGPVGLDTPALVARRIDVESALEMREALRKTTPAADVVVMAAAVADFRPGVRVLGKLSRRDGKRQAARAARAIPLVPNPDLLAEIGRRRRGGRPYLMGFAAEVGLAGQALVERARSKLAEKACDLVVANEVGRAGVGFGSDENAVTLVFSDGRVVDLSRTRKDKLARAIWDTIGPELTVRQGPAQDPRETVPGAKNQRTSRAKGRDA
ncbi:MAG: bifunctional phosphopantothenoylcysteine decarboxylase/phosphopantothenate--cysteine ligase CoaBC [Deltaproteobacteria bacterium]|nr:bifunctional phosphopantothenoylcysteine decarboxylase/phosphopantothenate--cysteine ligase CoaBC [Deltaproteobacteria bacterium]